MQKTPTTDPLDAERQARIAELRAEIAAGTYETREKLAAALEAFLASPPRDGESPADALPAPCQPR